MGSIPAKVPGFFPLGKTPWDLHTSATVDVYMVKLSIFRVVSDYVHGFEYPLRPIFFFSTHDPGSSPCM